MGIGSFTFHPGGDLCWVPSPVAGLCLSGTAVVGQVLTLIGGTLTETGFSFFLLCPFPLVLSTCSWASFLGHVPMPAPGLPGSG